MTQLFRELGHVYVRGEGGRLVADVASCAFVGEPPGPGDVEVLFDEPFAPEGRAALDQYRRLNAALKPVGVAVEIRYGRPRDAFYDDDGVQLSPPS